MSETTKPEVLAVILARGGSKGIPRKNLYMIAGKPLIVWTIESALQSKKITRTIVSTDDEEIAQVARDAGAETPFMRPAELAGDTTPDLPAFQHALNWLKENENYEPDFVVQLWATSPYRPQGEIDKAVALIEADPEADSVRSVTDPSQTPFKMWRTNGNYLEPILQKEYPNEYADGREPYALPRQVLPKVVVQTGYVTVVRPKVVLGGSMHGKKILPFFHDPETYTEFDSLKDVAHTEEVLRKVLDKMSK
jgi:N-acylneuraminate cytidylyltransferase